MCSQDDLVKFRVAAACRGVETGCILVFIPPRSAQVNFLWGKNDVRTAIQQFYIPQKLLYSQNKFLATPLGSGQLGRRVKGQFVIHTELYLP